MCRLFFLSFLMLIATHHCHAKRKAPPRVVINDRCDTTKAYWIMADDDLYRISNERKYRLRDSNGIWVYRRCVRRETVFFQSQKYATWCYDYFSLGPCDSLRELSRKELLLVFAKNKKLVDTLKKVKEAKLPDIGRRDNRTVVNKLYLNTLSEAAVKRE